MEKVMLLLKAGAVLSLTGSLSAQFRIARAVAREWREIERRALYDAIRKLYQSQLVDIRENDDATVSLRLSQEGKERVLRYDLDKLTLPKSKHWDGLWRMVIFDIPESQKQARNALSEKLKQLGFTALQKSVFVYPYDCKDEVDFVVEIFNVRPYVRFLLVQESDVDLHLRAKFRLQQQ